MLSVVVVDLTNSMSYGMPISEATIVSNDNEIVNHFLCTLILSYGHLDNTDMNGSTFHGRHSAEDNIRRGI